MTQFSATRTIIGAQGGLNRMTSADTCATTTKIPATNPIYATTTDAVQRIPAPFMQPCINPSKMASPDVTFRDNCAFAATIPPRTKNEIAVTGQVEGRISKVPNKHPPNQLAGMRSNPRLPYLARENR